MQTVAEMWAGYSTRVLPADCPDVQRTETRQAFYAGVWALLTELAGPVSGAGQLVAGGQLNAWGRVVSMIAETPYRELAVRAPREG